MTRGAVGALMAGTGYTSRRKEGLNPDSISGVLLFEFIDACNQVLLIFVCNGLTVAKLTNHKLIC
jgi:hypothetical protein